MCQMPVTARETWEQKMAELPSNRTLHEPPFTNCGVDMFGPFLIKEGIKDLKSMAHSLHVWIVGQWILKYM